jgi:hypothetical protein
MVLIKWVVMTMAMQIPARGPACATAASPPSPARALGRILMTAVGLAEEPMAHFEGSFYGVYARVALNMNTRVAHVTLSGIPLGGSLEGEGWLKSAGTESGPVVLQEEFAARRARRGVGFSRAPRDRRAQTGTVWASVPLLGEIEMVLNEIPPDA